MLEKRKMDNIVRAELGSAYVTIDFTHTKTMVIKRAEGFRRWRRAEGYHGRGSGGWKGADGHHVSKYHGQDDINDGDQKIPKL